MKPSSASAEQARNGSTREECFGGIVGFHLFLLGLFLVLPGARLRPGFERARSRHSFMNRLLQSKALLTGSNRDQVFVAA